MRILYLHQYYNTPDMSGSTRSYEMARRLVAMGHEVNMVTSWREGARLKEGFTTTDDGIKTHWLPVTYSNQMGHVDRIKAFFQFAFQAALKSASIRSDIILATSTPLTIALPGVFASRKQRIPMVFEVRDLWPVVPIAMGAITNPILKYMARKLEVFAYENSAAIVALSPDMRDGIISRGYPSDLVTVIPNGSDLDKFYPDESGGLIFRKKYNIPPEAVLVTYAGTFGKVNGVGFFIELAAAMKEDQRVYFLTVGDGQEFEAVKNLALDKKCLGLNLQMLSQIPKSQMSKVLAGTDIAVSTVIPVPELEANSANKVFDGFAAGCCVAINHGGWLAELLSSSGAGFSLPQAVDEAKRELSKWLNNPIRIHEAGIKARKLAEEQFARDKLANKLERVLLDAHERAVNAY